MKKIFPTIVVVLLFTLAFLCLFRACVGAEEISTETDEAEEIIDGVLDGEALEGEGVEQTNPSPAEQEFPLHNGAEEGSAETEIVEGEDQSLTAEGGAPFTQGSQEEEFDLKAYVEDRIVPVISGVGAAIVAMLVALRPLIFAIKAIKNAADSFSKKDEERNASQRESNKIMQKSIERIEKNVEDVTKLQAQIDAFKKQTDELKLVCATLAKITALGFQSNSDVVRSGKGKKMAVLLNKISDITGDNETSGVVSGTSVNGSSGTLTPTGEGKEVEA